MIAFILNRETERVVNIYIQENSHLFFPHAGRVSNRLSLPTNNQMKNKKNKSKQHTTSVFFPGTFSLLL